METNGKNPKQALKLPTTETSNNDTSEEMMEDRKFIRQKHYI